ncbi:MAG: arsenate reductase ArsC [Gaiellaceae bacterium]
MKKAYFVCIGNAGRSQMAQALYERRGGEARSAGSRPEQELHPQVIEAMKEIGIDLSDRGPKAITQEDVEWADVVVLMGCGDACPVIPGKQYVDWNLADPAAMSVAEVRDLRTEIEANIAAL